MAAPKHPTKKPKQLKKYTPEIISYIITQLSKGKNLTQICKPPGMPAPKTVKYWTAIHDDFRQKYQEARRDNDLRCGRPSDYNPDIASDMLDRIARGESITQVCNTKNGYPSYTAFNKWVMGGPDDFKERYRCARMEQADAHIEQTIDIADQAIDEIKQLEDPRHSSAIAKITTDRIRARQWKAARLHPTHWGDKAQVDITAQLKIVKPEDIKKGKVAGLGKAEAAKVS